MNLNVPFSEINEIIDKKLIVPLPVYFVYKNMRTIQLQFKSILFTKDIDVTVECIKGSDIYLNVDSGSTNKLLSFVKKLSSERLSIIEALDNRIILHLDKNEKLAQTMEQIFLQDISFNEDGAVVKFIPNI